MYLGPAAVAYWELFEPTMIRLRELETDEYGGVRSDVEAGSAWEALAADMADRIQLRGPAAPAETALPDH